jgi:hypothetical protein
MTVFGAGEDDISELLSEGSAITEVERELRGETALAGGGRLQQQHQQLHDKIEDKAASQRPQLAALTSLTSSPLHLHPSPSDDDDDGDVSDSESDSTPPQSSPGYIPTALQQRSDMLATHMVLDLVVWLVCSATWP